MSERFEKVSDREKQTLRLLLHGHDAKSIAATLGLSVHTVNERLREARRKLGVSSSREAARLLAQAEGQGPNILGDKEIGVAPPSARRDEPGLSKGRQRGAHAVAWLAGGMAIMFAIIAAVVIAMAPQGDGKAPAQALSAAAPSTASDKAGVTAAEDWAKLLDRRSWGDSWKQSGSLFRSQLTETSWTATIQPLRQQLGPVSSRTFKSVLNTSAPPGAPAGEYKMVQFATVFANRPDTVETVALVREGSAWRVIGYFIR